MEEVILTFKLFLGHPDPISFYPTPLLPWGGHSDSQPKSCPLLSFSFPGLRSTEATTSGQRSNTHPLLWVRLYNCQKYSESYISVNFPNIGMKLCAGCRPARVIGSCSLLSKCWWADVSIPGTPVSRDCHAKYMKNPQLICVLTVDNVKRRQAAVYRQLPPQARIGLGCYGNFSLLEGELSLKSCSLKSLNLCGCSFKD